MANIRTAIHSKLLMLTRQIVIVTISLILTSSPLSYGHNKNNCNLTGLNKPARKYKPIRFSKFRYSPLKYFENEIRIVLTDRNGNSYSVETTSLQTVTSNDYLSNKNRFSNIFISKLDSKGKILYSTYLGGSGDDYGTAIDVDSEGTIYVTGMTTSTDFPFTSSALQTRQAGVADAFVVKINPNLSGPESLIYATYLGGSESDMGLGIKVDKNVAAYVTGRTNSPDFPVTTGAVQPFTRGGGEAFVVKLSPDGSTLDFSTFLGGSGSDYAYSIDLDENGNAYIAGTTDSSDFPISLNAFQSQLAGKSDAFAACLSSAGNQLLYSSFFGSMGFDDAFEIKVDGAHRFHISGTTDADLNLNAPIQIEQDEKGNFKATFVFESPFLVGKK